MKNGVRTPENIGINLVRLLPNAEVVPYKIHTVLTDNGIQSTALPPTQSSKTEKGTRVMIDIFTLYQSLVVILCIAVPF